MESALLVTATLVPLVLTDKKTETRRLTGLDSINKLPDQYTYHGIEKIRGGTFAIFRTPAYGDRDLTIKSPYGGSGDLIWVRENWCTAQFRDDTKPRNLPSAEFTKPWYMADGPKPDGAGKTRPSIHLPRWLSRMTLEILSIHVERLHAIDDDGAVREGIQKFPGGYKTSFRQPGSETYLDGYSWTGKEEFAKLWRSINGPKSWDLNPWVWVIKFKRVTP